MNKNRMNKNRMNKNRMKKNGMKNYLKFCLDTTIFNKYSLFQ